MASGTQIFISVLLLFAILFVAGWLASKFYYTEVRKLKKKSFKQECEDLLRLANEIATKHEGYVEISIGKGFGDCSAVNGDGEINLYCRNGELYIPDAKQIGGERVGGI